MATTLAGKDFAEQLRTFAEKTELKIETVLQKTAFDLSADIIMATPFDTGLAKVSWIPTIGAPSKEVLEIDPIDTKEIANQIALDKVIPVKNDFGKDDQSFFLANNLPYIMRLEYGHSTTQAPQGMVRVNVARHQQRIAKIVNETK